MKTKILITILGMIMLIGMVVAGGNLSNVSPLVIGMSNMVAGEWNNIMFSWDFADDGFNNPDSSLVLQVNFSSANEDYPVWKGDFILNGMLKQYPLWSLDFLSRESALKCVDGEDVNFRVANGHLFTQLNSVGGVFYCYDPNNYINMMELDRRDRVELNFKPNMAIYPGNYNISIMPMEMEPDTQGPVIELVSPSDGGLYSEENEVIDIKLNITDMYSIDDDSVRYKITEAGLDDNGQGFFDYYDSGWIDLDFNSASGLYEDGFNLTERGLNKSGEYWIYVQARDVLGNLGEL